MPLPAVRVVTDSISDIPSDLAQELGITVVPALVNFGGQVFREGVDLSREEFYSRLASSPTPPGTGAPGPGAFEETYRSIIAQHTAAKRPLAGIVSIHPPAHLSALYNAAWVGARAVTDVAIHVIDSGTLTMAMGWLAIMAARAAHAGATLEETLTLVRQTMPRAEVLAVLDTLEYAARSGRINRVIAAVGGILSLKPILRVHEGDISPLERVRTKSRAFDRLVALVASRAPFQELAVMHARAPDQARELAERLSAYHPRERIIVAEIGVALGAHTGPGAYGACLIRTSS